MFALGVLLLLVWGYSFFYYENVPVNVSFGMMVGGLVSLGWGLLKEKKKQ